MTVFALRPDDSPGQRIARVATEALAAGPMGAYIRGEDYAAFLDGIWGNGQALRFVHTSCAVFAGACIGYAGHPLKHPWNATGGWGITSWLNLDTKHPAWTLLGDPEVGDVCYWGSLTGGNGHVGVVLERLPSGLYRTAEGGGSPGPELLVGLTLEQIKRTNGTLCRMSGPEGKDISHSVGRPRTGFWRAALLGLPSYEDILGGIFPPQERPTR